MTRRLLALLPMLLLHPAAFASSGGGGNVATNGGTFQMTYNASLQQSGTVTQCVGGLVTLGFAGQQTWSMTGSASSTTNRGSSYLGVWLQLYQTNSAVISFAQDVRTSGPVTAASKSVTNERKCFSEPLQTGWKTVSTHKARPMPGDPDAGKGDVYVEGYTYTG